jgi:hypothetical protein
METRTNELRWEYRMTPHGSYGSVLQQKWVVVVDGVETEEWRDVPHLPLPTQPSN